MQKPKQRRTQKATACHRRWIMVCSAALLVSGATAETIFKICSRQPVTFSLSVTESKSLFWYLYRSWKRMKTQWRRRTCRSQKGKTRCQDPARMRRSRIVCQQCREPTTTRLLLDLVLVRFFFLPGRGRGKGGGKGFNDDTHVSVAIAMMAN